MIPKWRVDDLCVRCRLVVERWTNSTPWLFCLKCFKEIKDSLAGPAAT